MARISEQECQYTDLEWYGVDRSGNIAVFLSAGEGNIPEFVCEDRERTEGLNDYFGSLGQRCEATLCMELSGGALKLARELSGRGLFYFDSDDGMQPGVCNGQRYYTKHADPVQPLKFADLPGHIREMLKQNRMDVDNFAAVNEIHIEHVYHE